MAGHLARWLRLAGCDAEYAGTLASDADVQAAAGPRLLVTSDRVLAQQARAKGLAVVEVAATGLEDQLVQVFAAAGGMPPPEEWFTRCTHCNGALDAVGADEVSHSVPSAVLGSHDEFHRCRRCRHVYWEGTHTGRIRATLETVRARLGTTSRAG